MVCSIGIIHCGASIVSKNNEFDESKRDMLVAS
jgi:hypothetical protein